MGGRKGVEQGFLIPNSFLDGAVMVVTGPPADTTFLLNFILSPQLMEPLLAFAWEIIITLVHHVSVAACLIHYDFGFKENE